MQPQNAILGDDTFDLPSPTMDEKDLQVERNMASLRNSAEWKSLKEYFESRIDFYQRFLPNGQPVAVAPKGERDAYWVAANVIIEEFHAVIGAYDATTEAVEDAQ